MRKKLEKDIALIERSVKHWTAVIRRDENPDVESCPLCIEYSGVVNKQMKDDDHCVGCPIYEDTNDTRSCKGTVFEDALEEYRHGRHINLQINMLQYLQNLKDEKCKELERFSSYKPYSRGDIVEFTNSEDMYRFYIIAQMEGRNEVALVNLIGGSRKRPAAQVKDKFNISENEIKTICGERHYEHLKKLDINIKDMLTEQTRAEKDHNPD